MGGGAYAPFHFDDELNPLDIVISDDMFVITKETAKEYRRREYRPETVEVSTECTARASTTTEPRMDTPAPVAPIPTGNQVDLPTVPGIRTGATSVHWKGQVPPQKWMNFYTKVISCLAALNGLKVGLDVEVSSDDGLTKNQLD